MKETLFSQSRDKGFFFFFSFFFLVTRFDSNVKDHTSLKTIFERALNGKGSHDGLSAVVL